MKEANGMGTGPFDYQGEQRMGLEPRGQSVY